MSVHRMETSSVTPRDASSPSPSPTPYEIERDEDEEEQLLDQEDSQEREIELEPDDDDDDFSKVDASMNAEEDEDQDQDQEEIQQSPSHGTQSTTTNQTPANASTTNTTSTVSASSSSSSTDSTSAPSLSSSATDSSSVPSTTTSSSTPATSTTTTAPTTSSSTSSSSSSTSSSTTSSSGPAPPPPVLAPSSSRVAEDKSYKIAVKRLMSDFKQMDTDPPEGVSGAPLDPTAPFVWRCAVFGPPDTAWEGGVFQLQMQFGADYPQKPPSVRFITKMFHPNVFADGNLCLDIIQDKWSPVYSVSTILTSIQSLLSDPNAASPANPEAAKLFASKNEADKKEYRKRVRACVEKSTAN